MEKCELELQDARDNMNEDWLKMAEKHADAEDIMDVEGALQSLILRRRYNLHYTLHSIHYTLYNIQSAIYNLQYTIYNLQSTIYNLQYTIYNI